MTEPAKPGGRFKPGHPGTGLRLFGQSLAHTRPVSLDARSGRTTSPLVRAAPGVLGQQHPNVRVGQRRNQRHCWRIGVPMPQRRYSVLIETAKGRMPARFTVPATATQVDVAMKVRELGLEPYRVQLDPGQAAWVVTVIDWKRAAGTPVRMCAPPGFRGRHGNRSPRLKFSAAEKLPIWTTAPWLAWVCVDLAAARRRGSIWTASKRRKRRPPLRCCDPLAAPGRTTAPTDDGTPTVFVALRTPEPLDTTSAVLVGGHVCALPDLSAQ